MADSKSALPEGFDFEPFPETGSKAPSPRDLCARGIESLQPKQVFAVGGKAWQVDRSHGLTKYLTPGPVATRSPHQRWDETSADANTAYGSVWTKGFDEGGTK